MNTRRIVAWILAGIITVSMIGGSGVTAYAASLDEDVLLEELVSENDALLSEESEEKPLEENYPELGNDDQIIILPDCSTSFVARTTAPEPDNPWYYSNQNVYYGTDYGPPAVDANCTWYAFGRASELLGERAKCGIRKRDNASLEAKSWYDNDDGYARGSTPRLGAVACKINGNHVAVVEDIVPEKGEVVLSNSAWGGDTFYMTWHADASAYNYIYVGDFSGSTPTPTPAQDEFTGKCGDNLTWTLKDDGQNKGYYILTISGSGEMYDYAGWYDTPWQQKSRELKECRYKDIVIQEGITKIGNYAFSNMYAGNGVFNTTIPETVKEIGSYAFSGCSIGGQLNIPDSVQKIGERAFEVTKITGITFGNGITEIPEYCFSSCEKLGGTIDIPDNIVSIGEWAFSLSRYSEYNEIVERKVILPNTLKEIGREAFYCNENLTSVSPLLPSKLEKIGWGAFEGCTNLMGTLTIPENIYIEYMAFKDCRSLTGVLKIPGTMYYSYNGDTKQPIGGICDRCFEGCSGFTGLVIEEGIMNVGSKAFYNCTGIAGELKIPSGCYIASEAFKNCSLISKLTIPSRRAGAEKVKIRQGSFENCSGLTGTLTLNQNDVSGAGGNLSRTFWGTNYNIIRLEGDCRGGTLERELVGKNVKGTYDTDWSDPVEDVDLATFPKDVTIFYEDKFFIAGRDADGTPGWEEEETIKVLDKLAYIYKSFSAAGIDSPNYYIVDVEAYDKTVALDSPYRTSIYKPHNPQNVDDSDKIIITVEDESVATLERQEGKNEVIWNIIPHKVGKTSYTVSINTHDYGLQTAKGTITVTGNANQSEHRVTFVLNGGECTDLGYWKDKPDDVIKGEDIIEASYIGGVADITKLPLPVYEGRKFEGWYSDEIFKKAVKKIPKKTTSDLILYAKWSAPYRVILHNGADSKIYKGFTLSKPKALAANPFKRTDAALVGWSLSADSDEVKYLNKEKLINPEIVLEDGVLTLNLYAVWQSDFTISVDLRGGEYGPKEKNHIPDGYTYAEISKKAITLPKIIVRDGYKFLGMYDTVTDTKITKITKATCRNYDLVAKWSPLTYQIAYNANAPKGLKAKGKMPGQKMTFGMEDSMLLRANAFTLDGYTFQGWTTDPASMEVEFDDEGQFSFGEGGYKKKVSLYAVWDK